MTTIKLKNGSGAPLAGDLVQGEPALDLTNKRLYTEDSGGTVIEVGTNPTSLTTGTFTSTGIDDNAASTAITIDGSQNVGIGTSSPTTALTVSTDGTEQLTINRADSSINSGNTVGTILFTGDDPSANQTGAKIQVLAGSNWTTNDYSSHITFSNDNNGTLTERMRIDSSGNVLVGTTSTSGGRHFTIGNATAPAQSFQQNGTEKFLCGVSGGINGGVTGSASGDYFARTTGGKMLFSTDDGVTAHAVINSSGNVGINNSSPIYKLDLNGDMRFTSGSAMFWADTNVYEGRAGNDRYWVTGGSERMRIDSSGNLLVGTTGTIDSGTSFKSGTPLGVYRTTGTAAGGVISWWSDNGSTQSLKGYTRADGGIANYSANDVNLSDERVKTNIAPLGSMWDKFKALEIVTFKYKDQTHDNDNIGVIAQQVESVAPEFVDNEGFGETPEGEEPLKAIFTADLYHATIRALQEAIDRIETLEAEVTALKGD